jgi:hypothetical protein
MENSMEIPQNTKIGTYDPDIHSCIYTREMKSAYQRDICMPLVISALFNNS